MHKGTYLKAERPRNRSLTVRHFQFQSCKFSLISLVTMQNLIISPSDTSFTTSAFRQVFFILLSFNRSVFHSLYYMWENSLNWSLVEIHLVGGILQVYKTKTNTGCAVRSQFCDLLFMNVSYPGGVDFRIIPLFGG